LNNHSSKQPGKIKTVDECNHFDLLLFYKNEKSKEYAFDVLTWTYHEPDQTEVSGKIQRK
jgi:hypothetical protein